MTILISNLNILLIYHDYTTPYILTRLYTVLISKVKKTIQTTYIETILILGIYLACIIILRP